MMRRDLFKASMVTGAAALLSKPSLDTKYDDIPPEVIALGKKSILDGFGLALAGSLAESGPISRSTSRVWVFAKGNPRSSGHL